MVAPTRTAKKSFDVGLAIRRIRKAIEPLPKAAMFQLASEGYDSTFEQLVACMISIRTRDEVTVPTAHALYNVARKAADVAKLSVAKIDELIHPCTFHHGKAGQIREIAQVALRDHDGDLPCDREVLESLRGVGPKCASLVLGIACGEPSIGVDVHVHRVTNRWRYVSTPTPKQTMTTLHGKLPKRYWIELNSLLVPFGKHICTGRAPKCSTCPVLDMCRQIGVTSHR